MKKIIRRSVFETNSSATHTISLLSSFELNEMEPNYDVVATSYEGLKQKKDFLIANILGI